MKRLGLVSLTLLILTTACSQRSQMTMEPPQKPEPAPQLAELNRFVGEWSGRAEFVEPSYEVMQASMPEGQEMPKYFAVAESYEWTLGGMALRTMGWHDMGEGQRANYEGMMTWDPKDQVYSSWWCDDWGNRATGTMEIDEDGKTFRIKAQGFDGHGNKSRGEGTWTFLSDDTIQWTWAENGAMGRMKMKGTSKRVH